MGSAAASSPSGAVALADAATRWASRRCWPWARCTSSPDAGRRGARRADAGRTGRRVGGFVPAPRASRLLSHSPVLTVGTADHVPRSRAGAVAVLVKLRSSMQRFGAAPDELGRPREGRRGAGLDRAGFSIHLPLAGTDDAHLAEVGRGSAALDLRSPTRSCGSATSTPPPTPHSRERWPAWVFPMRTGTALWHGDKSAFHLGANVLDVRAVTGGTSPATARWRSTATARW